ncbi:hypothetical protein ACIQNU_02830 [Streptomyces sp. NPDC091292]|uniref:hypothetical protein n=1 Tax=Streptomyces sp. NPDC091292 TaxID=3365991 RepID=UPI0037F8F618
MPYVIALTVLFGALCLFNIVLTVGVVRRLREMRESGGAGSGLPGGARRANGPPAVMLPAGAEVGAFAAVSTEGDPVDDGFLAGAYTMVGVFAHGCAQCEERLPEFVSFARARAAGRDQVLAVLVGTPEEVEGKRAAAQEVATVVIERLDGPVSTALGAKVYPALAVVGPDKVVRASGTRMEDLSLSPSTPSAAARSAAGV